MSRTKIADEIMGNYINGNQKDAVDMLFELDKGDALIVATIIGRDYEHWHVNPFISQIYSKMGIE